MAVGGGGAGATTLCSGGAAVGGGEDLGRGRRSGGEGGWRRRGMMVAGLRSPCSFLSLLFFFCVCFDDGLMGGGGLDYGLKVLMVAGRCCCDEE